MSEAPLEQLPTPERYIATLRVTLGKNGHETTAYLLGKRRAGQAFTETWWVNGQTFICDDDRRYRWFSEGEAIGSIPDDEGNQVFIYALERHPQNRQ